MNDNHLVFLDEIKLFAKHKKELGMLIQKIRIYSLAIGMEKDNVSYL